MRIVALASIVGAALLVGCPAALPSLGEISHRCERDEQCPVAQQCRGGYCVVAVADAASGDLLPSDVALPDAALRDAPARDGAIADRGDSEAGPRDRADSDRRPADGTPGDSSRPDQVASDRPSADTRDAAASDAAAADTPAPDAALTDAALPDTARFDTAAGDAGPCVDNALAFDGIDDFVTFQDDPDLDVGPQLTIEAWIRPADVRGERYVVVHANPSAPNGYDLLLRDGTLRLRLFTGTGLVEAPSGADPGILLQNDRWYHVAGSYDGATLRVFVNGRLSASNDCGAQTIITTGQPLRIGANTSGTIAYFAGIIDEVRISASARYTANFAVPVAPFVDDSDTRLLLHLDEGAGQIVADSAGALADGRLGSSGSTEVSDPSWIGTACMLDRNPALSCNELFVSAPSYYLCIETAASCEFYIYGGSMQNCTAVCGARGLACLAAYGNVGYCEHSTNIITCETYYTDEICLCAR